MPARTRRRLAGPGKRDVELRRSQAPEHRLRRWPNGHTARTGIDALPPPSAASSLGRTLQLNTNGALRNVELLLETRGAGEHKRPAASRLPPVLPSTGLAANARGAGPEVERPPVAEPVPESVRMVTRTLREHRSWLPGAVGVVTALAAVVQLLRRCRAGACVAFARWPGSSDHRAGSAARRGTEAPAKCRGPGLAPAAGPGVSRYHRWQAPCPGDPA